MKEHSRPCCVLTTKRLLLPSGRIPPKVNTTVHKVNGPNQGQIYTIPKSGQTQPGLNLYKSKKWTDPTRVKLTSPQSGRIPPRVNTSPQSGRTQPGSNLYKSKKWMDQLWVKLTQVHKADGPQQGLTPIHKVDGPTRVKLIRVHKVDGPHQGSTPIHKVDGLNQGQTYISSQSGRTQPGSNLYKFTKWTDPTKATSFYKTSKRTDHTKVKNHDPHNGQTQ